MAPTPRNGRRAAPAAGDLFGDLLASAQAGLADVPAVTDYRAKRVLIASARVQAVCAVAIATRQLATEVGRLVDTITTEEENT